MSIVSNHFPEALYEDDLATEDGTSQPEPHCCNPQHVEHLCPDCRLDYEAWSRQLDFGPPAAETAEAATDFDRWAKALPGGLPF